MILSPFKDRYYLVRIDYVDLKFFIKPIRDIWKNELRILDLVHNSLLKKLRLTKWI